MTTNNISTFCKKCQAIICECETNKSAEETAFELYPRVINDPYNPQEDDNKEYRDIFLKGVDFSASQNQDLIKSNIEKDAEILKLREALIKANELIELAESGGFGSNGWSHNRTIFTEEYQKLFPQ